MAVSFAQQGTVDWTALVSGGGNLSVQLLQRISAAGIDPFTIVVGQTVCGRFLWGPDGRKRFDEALQRCRGLAGYRNALWFGFGVRHVASILTATDQGATCAALCACIAECYTSDYAAEVLMEMTKESQPFETTPSLVQWRNLVNSCAGLVTNSTFGIRAETFMRLVGDWRLNSWQGRPGPWTGYRGAAHQREIAETLLGLAKLSKNVLSQMTVVGGADAGFIAAVADWLLGLDVEIRGGKENDTLFRNRGPEREPQLLVIYEKDVANDSLQCVGQTYRLSDASQVIRREDGFPRDTVLSGRVPWDKALEYTFCKSFEGLMDRGQALGSAIGSAARIYQGLFDGEGSPSEWLRGCRSYFPDSYGPAFVHFVLMRFPELESLRDSMTAAANVVNCVEAGKNFDAQMMIIADYCVCHSCCPSKVGLDHPSEQRPFCLVYLAHTVTVVSRALSGMITELRPMRSGLELMYQKVVGSNGNIPATARGNILERNGSSTNNGILGTQEFLQRADIIFGGDRMSNSKGRDWISALADNGLCCFFDILIDPSFGAGRAAQVHVIGGRIEHEGRAYDKLSDAGPLRVPPYRGAAEAKGFPERELDELTKGYGGQLEVLVRERLDGLTMDYGISKNGTICHSFGPARAVHAMYCNEGLVSTCYGRCTRTPQLIEMRNAAMSCINSDDLFCRWKGDEYEFLFVLGDTWTRLGVVAHAWDPLIQRVECLACCIRYAIGTGSKYNTIIMGKNYVAGMKMNEARKSASKVIEEGKE